MKSYKITEIVEAKEMNRLQYNDYRGWIVPSDENPLDEGFYVVRKNGHESWFPKDTFLLIAEIIKP